MKAKRRKSIVKRLDLIAIPNLPLIEKGDNIAELIVKHAKQIGIDLQRGDIIVIAQKIVSKAEGRTVSLTKVSPSKEARELSRQSAKDPRLCELILKESKQILFIKKGVVICEHKLGFVCTSAGIDRSNSGSATGGIAVLLPKNPDASARRVRQDIKTLTGIGTAVIINDSLGRPFRKGSVGMAIGVAGISPVLKKKKTDLFGRQSNPQVAIVDEIAGAASALMGQTDEKRPVVIVRGIDFTKSNSAKIKDLLRPVAEDQIWEK